MSSTNMAGMRRLVEKLHMMFKVKVFATQNEWMGLSGHLMSQLAGQTWLMTQVHMLLIWIKKTSIVQLSGKPGNLSFATVSTLGTMFCKSFHNHKCNHSQRNRVIVTEIIFGEKDLENQNTMQWSTTRFKWWADPKSQAPQWEWMCKITEPHVVPFDIHLCIKWFMQETLELKTKSLLSKASFPVKCFQSHLTVREIVTIKCLCEHAVRTAYALFTPACCQTISTEQLCVGSQTKLASRFSFYPHYNTKACHLLLLSLSLTVA